MWTIYITKSMHACLKIKCTYKSIIHFCALLTIVTLLWRALRRKGLATGDYVKSYSGVVMVDSIIRNTMRPQ